jgi:SAM-dependent methyltransferase
MLDFRQRSLQKELLDQAGIPHEDLILNMQELDTINRYLGGHAITCAGFKKLIGNHTAARVLEIGCGGGDNLRAIHRYAKTHGIDCTMIGVDINSSIARFAQEKNPDFEIHCADYSNLSLTNKPDIIFSSLFCHHFSQSELVEQVQWMQRNANLGFFINDLERNSLAYYGIKLLTQMFSNSYLVKNDAPLSVARGFRKKEWQEIFFKAGIQPVSIIWKWAFRHLITYQHA